MGQQARVALAASHSMPRPWAVDLTEHDGGRPDLPKPPGFAESSGHEQDDRVAVKKGDQTQLKLKKANELALSPGKNFMMTGFMLWMSGNGVHIFSIMITFYAIYNPIKAAFTVNSAFTRFVDPKMTPMDRTGLLTSKMLFVVLNLLAMSGALYK